MFGKTIVTSLLAAVMILAAGVAMADTFGTGGNQFTINFMPISGATNPSSGIPAGDGFTFTGVANSYRMGTYEVTNDQWNKFTAAYGMPTGSDEGYGGYRCSSNFTGTNVPTDSVSWYEAAQFVNWLNTSTNHQAAYNFTGTQGTSDYTLTTWSPAEADGTNLYRNKAAKYYLPTEDEWVKAAYWNGTALQTYATKAGQSLTQGNGISGTGWNYNNTYPNGPWAVGSGSQELNGTYDMMGNDLEWMESPYITGDYDAGGWRGVRGGWWLDGSDRLAATNRDLNHLPWYEGVDVGS